MSCHSSRSRLSYISPRTRRSRGTCVRPPPRRHRELQVVMSDDYQPQVFKIVIVGDHQVGKTSLLHRWRGDCFEPFSKPTIGFDLCVGDYELAEGHVRLQLWDTAGQEKFNCVTTVQFRNAKGIIFVYDVSVRKSFDRIADYWLDRVDAYMDEAVPIFLVANKMDMERAKREVTTDEGERLATAQAASGFYETSAKTGQQVEELFDSIAHTMQKTWGLFSLCDKESSQAVARRNSDLTDHGMIGSRNRGRRLGTAMGRRPQDNRCCKGATKTSETLALTAKSKPARSPFEPRSLPRS